MSLLYHAYVFFGFLILACTIYILTAVVAMLTFAEYYNGKNKDIKSTYLYGGALDEEGNNICAGKYTSDHVFDPNAVDDQPGLFLLLNSILE